MLPCDRAGDIRLLDGELHGFEFCDEAEVARRLAPRAWCRMRGALGAARTGRFFFLQDGKPLVSALPDGSVLRRASLYGKVNPTWDDTPRRREIHRLVLWNIDLTLVDVAKVTRAAYAEAFGKVTGRPLVQLPQMAGRTEPETFFDALALNGVNLRDAAASERLLAPFGAELANSMAARRDQLTTQGQVLPGAADSLAAVAMLRDTVQSVLTGSSRPNATLKLRAFRLDPYLDLTVGGFAGSDPYPKGALLRVARQRAEEKYKVTFPERATFYIGDSPRDVEAATIGGATPLAVASGRASTAELRDAGADAVLSDLTDPASLITHITAWTPS